LHPFLPLRPRWWGGRTFIEEWNLSWWVLALIPLPLDPVTVRGAFIEGFVENLAELILYAHSPTLPLCGCVLQAGGAGLSLRNVLFLFWGIAFFLFLTPHKGVGLH
jgi:hypothetical protein